MRIRFWVAWKRVSEGTKRKPATANSATEVIAVVAPSPVDMPLR